SHPSRPSLPDRGRPGRTGDGGRPSHPKGGSFYPPMRIRDLHPEGKSESHHVPHISLFRLGQQNTIWRYTNMKFGALEAGGTKMVCAIGNENGEILERISIPTETPEKTLPAIAEFFQGKDIKALGIGCFGPIDVHKDSPTYGYITTTPKLAW